MSTRTIEMTDDMLRDLVSLYLAKEASADTNRLVEGFLRENPALAQEVARASRLLAPSDAAPRREPDLRALHDTQRLLFRRSLGLGLGIFFTLLPFSCYGNEQGIHFIFLEGGPISVILPWLGAAGWWFSFFRARAKLKVAGF